MWTSNVDEGMYAAVYCTGDELQCTTQFVILWLHLGFKLIFVWTTKYRSPFDALMGTIQFGSGEK